MGKQVAFQCAYTVRAFETAIVIIVQRRKQSDQLLNIDRHCTIMTIAVSNARTAYAHCSICKRVRKETAFTRIFVFHHKN